MKNTLILPLLLIFSLIVSAQNNTVSQGEMITKNVYHEIPVANSHDEIAQTVTLKGKQFKFILDTGAPLSISKELQEMMKYPILNSAVLKDANNKSDNINIVMVDTVKIGNISFTNIPALVLDFKNSPIGCENIDGLIGSNIVRFLIVQFDLSKNKIILTDRPDKIILANKNAPKPVALDDQSNPFLEVGLSGRLIDSVQFDSGMGKLYDMNVKKTQELLKGLSQAKVYKGFGVAGQGVFGNANAETVHMLYSDIKLGTNQIDDAQIRTTQAPSRMGRELFNYGTLTINYIKSQYYFDPYPKRLNKEKSNFGFDIIPSQGKVMVSVVWENTLAQKSGLVSGSELVSINDITFQNMNSCEIDSMLLPEFSKKEIKVQFIKNGIVKKATLKAIEQTK